MWRHWPYSTVLLAALLFALVGAAGAQTPSEAPAAEKAFPADQIQQIVAPIALYPDALIAQILMAATYPLDVVQANRWLGDQEGVEGEALQSAVDSETWDDSVKALVFFPSVLQFMSDNLDWTQDLGDAVLAQQGDVTETIQRLRGEADEAGALASNEQQRVEKAGDTIIIQPAQPEVVYVPTYDPVKVYGESAPPATQYYPDAYADASASYDAGYAAGVSAGGSTTALVPSGQVVPADGAYTTSAVDTSNSGLINFGVGALAGGLLTAAIMWDDDDDWNDRIYYGGGGRYGGPSYWGGRTIGTTTAGASPPTSMSIAPATSISIATSSAVTSTSTRASSVTRSIATTSRSGSTIRSAAAACAIGIRPPRSASAPSARRPPSAATRRAAGSARATTRSRPRISPRSSGKGRRAAGSPTWRRSAGTAAATLPD